MRILLVEDNPGDVRLLRGYLAEPGGDHFEITHVDRLGSGCACLSEGQYDVVLLDLSLPDSQGIETLVKVHAAARSRPIVVLTGVGDEALGMRLVQAGAQDYLEKGTVTGPLLKRSLRYAIERKQVEEMLRRSEQELRDAFRERERISQDLHDNLIQSLYAVGLGIETAKPLLVGRPDAAERQLDEAVRQLNGAIKEVREFIAQLESRSSVVIDLQWALATLVRSLGSARPDFLEVDIDRSALSLVRAEHAVDLLSVAREAVSNCLRHARAERGQFRICREQGGIRLEVKDDGIGFDVAAEAGHGKGLGNMASRAGRIGGQLTVDSKPGEGTRVVLIVPTSPSTAGL